MGITVSERRCKCPAVGRHNSGDLECDNRAESGQPAIDPADPHLPLLKDEIVADKTRLRPAEIPILPRQRPIKFNHTLHLQRKAPHRQTIPQVIAVEKQHDASGEARAVSISVVEPPFHPKILRHNLKQKCHRQVYLVRTR